MKKNYYINKHAESNGDHEVHDETCIYLLLIQSRMFVGAFTSCEQVIAVAKIDYPTANGCNTCLPGCHTKQSQDQQDLMEK